MVTEMKRLSTFILAAVMVFSLAACGESKTTDAPNISGLLDAGSVDADDLLASINETASGEGSDLREFAAALGSDPINYKGGEAIVAAWKHEAAQIVFLFFNQDDPKTNVPLFADIVNEYGESLLKDGEQALFIGLSTSDELVISYDIIKSEFFKPYYTDGLLYYENGETLPPNRACEYREAYLELEGSKGVLTSCDVTKAMASKTFQEDDMTDACRRFLGVSDTGGMPFCVYQFTDQMLLSTMLSMPEIFKTVVTDGLIAQAKDGFMESSGFGTIFLFDAYGYRVTVLGVIKGEADRQEWYNGYSAP